MCNIITVHVLRLSVQVEVFRSVTGEFCSFFLIHCELSSLWLMNSCPQGWSSGSRRFYWAAEWLAEIAACSSKIINTKKTKQIFLKMHSDSDAHFSASFQSWFNHTYWELEALLQAFFWFHCFSIMQNELHLKCESKSAQAFFCDFRWNVLFAFLVAPLSHPATLCTHYLSTFFKVNVLIKSLCVSQQRLRVLVALTTRLTSLSSLPFPSPAG